jgi:CHASE3 domain sensor protein
MNDKNTNGRSKKEAEEVFEGKMRDTGTAQNAITSSHAKELMDCIINILMDRVSLVCLVRGVIGKVICDV